MMRRFILALVAMGGFLLIAPSPAQAQATSCVDYLSDLNLYLVCSGGPTITVTPGETTPGSQVLVNLTGWLPGSSVAVSIMCGSDSLALGNVTIGANAIGEASFTVPATCPLGPTSVSGTGPSMLNEQTTREGPVVLVSSAVVTTVPSTNLPVTGSDSTGRLVTLGASLLVIGAAALYGSLRSRNTAS